MYFQYSRQIKLLALCLITQMISSCGFLNAASEITFGVGSLPAMEQAMEYPSVDQLVGLGEGSEIPGLPASLNEGTMAHLVGALGVGGECGRSLDLGADELGASVRTAEFALAACTEDKRCADLCPNDFLGLNARTKIEMVVMQAKQAQEIGQYLSEDSAEAIMQVRFQIKALDFFQGEGDDREVTNDHIKGFEMLLGTPGVEPILFLGPQDLKRIRESALATAEEGAEERFERYELPREHPVTKKIISDILEGNDVIVSVEQKFKIDRDSLYDLRLSPAGVYQSLQPEVVINAIEATTSTLSN